MKRFLSFIIWTILLIVLSFHNQVMAFWSWIEVSMWNHMNMDSKLEKCHWDNLENCESICCFDTDFSFQNLNLNISNNKKIFDKLKCNLYELSFNQSFIYEWNLIGNISPPEKNVLLWANQYISLTWIIKSNI